MSDYSRPLKFAAAATGTDISALEKHLAGQEVAISVDAELPQASLTAHVLITTLTRLPGKTVLDPVGLPSDVASELSAAAAEINGEPLELGRGTGRAIRVHVGTRAPDAAIRIVPEGFGAHVSSDASVRINATRTATALGAVYAAALGATEVFKLAAAMPMSRALPHRHLSFCPVSLSSDLHIAPDLPPVLVLDLGLIGVGAVGSATALILSELDAAGSILLVDRERFSTENIGTYTLGGQQDAAAKTWKVELAARRLRSRYRVITSTKPVEELTDKIDNGELPWPHAILSGLDSIPARHATQRLWPDLLIDAATGDTIVGIHVYQPDSACLICHLPPRTSGPSSTEQLATATGLAIPLLARGDNELAATDLEGLTNEQQDILRPHIGKPICGLAEAIGLTDIDSNGYQPAIPFAAQQAAVFGVGRLLAHMLHVPRPDNIVQFDVFRGPTAATIETRQQLPGCYCQRRASTISRVRELRAGMNRKS